MGKFVETITLTRDSYDELIEKFEDAERDCSACHSTIKCIEEENELLREKVWKDFKKGNSYYFTSSNTFEEFMEDFNRRVVNKDLLDNKLFVELKDLLGLGYIEKKVKEYYDNASKKSND